jgi:NMD protein affecting ribosome stability and mRNA decay
VSRIIHKESKVKDSLSDDLLRGAGEIAKFVYGDAGERRKVYHAASTRQMPTFKMGDVICARKSVLLAHIERQETNSLAQPSAKGRTA